MADPFHHGDTIVRFFYLKDAATHAEMQQVADQIRAATKLTRSFPYISSKVLALRGTPEQIGMAEQILHDRQTASK